MYMKNKKSPETGRPRSKKGSRLRRHRRSVLMICIILFCLSGVLAVGSLTLHARNTQYKEQEAELKAKIEDEEKRSEEIEKYEEYVQTDEYIKDTAENKLNLVDPNEIVFKPAE